MEFFAKICYKGSIANFKILREDGDIFTAKLINYEGDLKDAPPQVITLVKSVSQWTGSCSDISLLNRIGNLIEVSFPDRAGAA